MPESEKQTETSQSIYRTNFNFLSTGIAALASFLAFLLIRTTFTQTTGARQQLYLQLPWLETVANLGGFYALIYVGGGFLLYKGVLPLLLQAERPAVERPPVRQRQIWYAALVAAALYGWIHTMIYMGAGTMQVKPPIWQLVSSIVLTPLLEETFYRFLFQGFLLRRIHPLLALSIPSLCFAFAHDSSIAVFLIPHGFAFGFLFWRFGWWPAVLSHSLYNTFIILTAFL
jgi:membrane protease YdiL (CAAX protease family)